MTKRESKNLRVKDIVKFSDGVGGRVTEAGAFSVTIEWADGQTGQIAHEDMRDVTLKIGQLSKRDAAYMKKSTADFIKRLQREEK